MKKTNQATHTHTPGPWKILPPQTPLDFVTKQTKRIGQAICSVEKAFTAICIHAEPDGKPCPNVAELDGQGAANARLIAAAPELLEACKMIAKWLHSEELAPNRLEVVLKAIEKATGETRNFHQQFFTNHTQTT